MTEHDEKEGFREEKVRRSFAGCLSGMNSNKPSAVSIESDKEGKGGLFAVSTCDVNQGDKIMESFSVSIALEHPYRSSRCGFCASSLLNQQNNFALSVCKGCRMVAICSNCEKAGAKKWHEESGECRVLSCLVLCFKHLFLNSESSNPECSNIISDKSKVLEEDANEVDSTIFLTIRLMCRKWSDSQRTKINSSDSLPCVDWDLFDSLYSSRISKDEGKSDNESTNQYNIAIGILCTLIQEEFTKSEKDKKNEETDTETGSWDGSWITKENFDEVLGKVMGCCHAVTDVTLDLGCQCLGRALFLEHSFYNHSCVPSSFLSCHFPKNSDHTDQNHSCALKSRVFCLQDIEKGMPLTLSYIPTSGLDKVERNSRLKDGYNFECQCVACVSPDEKSIWERHTKIPPGSDVNALRQVQYSCNQSLLEIQHNLTENPECDIGSDLENCIGLIHMCSRGIDNQKIPSSHEVSIEVHRLLATAFSLSGKMKDSFQEHRAFFESVEPIKDIFDPVAVATQRLKFSLDLEKDGEKSEALSQLSLAHALCSNILGADHLLTESIFEKKKMIKEPRLSKKPKLN